ncbi:hypothetical protein HPB52_001128 [Rhipicephalus sanguineus]|uniref:Tick transposon n=1 Tax=Rhipicephalus sanguineus TaxID=34632 RepID=A0A9D4SQF6_RHISA|nr:hypothetical protein HPB52_001128 [Rhipicephalus sanguineus]
MLFRESEPGLEFTFVIVKTEDQNVSKIEDEESRVPLPLEDGALDEGDGDFILIAGASLWVMVEAVRNVRLRNSRLRPGIAAISTRFRTMIYKTLTPLTIEAAPAVAARDNSQARLKKLLVTVHPDRRVANRRGPMLLLETGHQEGTSLSAATADRLCVDHGPPIPEGRCGDPETLEHLLCSCPGLAKERSTVTTVYRRQGLPATTLEHLLFPSRPHLPALRSLADFLEETGIAAYH